MKIIKFLGLAILIVIVMGLISAAFIKKDFHFEKSVEIGASKETVWQNVVMFANHDKWSQWKELDPLMKVTITGNDGEVGAKMAWTSDHKDVGNGTQTITSVIPGQRVDSDLDFDGKGKAKTYMAVNGDSTKCKTTWALDMHLDYPFNLFGALFAEKGMNEMFDKGLGMLKTTSEK
jgi:uncharacterized protein YndB with AHSA1/START domain